MGWAEKVAMNKKNRTLSWRMSAVCLLGALLSACGGGQTGVAAAASSGSGQKTVSAAGDVATEATEGLWSNPATWGGSKPVAGAAVLIPAGMRVVLDENTPALGELAIEGELVFKPMATVTLTAEAVRVRAGGLLGAGTSTAPFTGQATITLTSTNVNQDVTGMGTRGILVTAGGRLALFGTAPTVAWTRLNGHAAAGATRLRLATAVNWQAGDQVVVAPTEWYPYVWASQDYQDAQTQTERRTVAATAGSSLNLTAGLSTFKWGRLQYVTDAGMSLTKGVFTKPDPNAVDTLDERAEVGNLSRNIVIQGLDDALWRNQGYGAQVMVMDRASMLQMDGVELRRVGQAGKLGRYPIHWHLLSYAANGTELGDATGHFVRNSTVWDSRQRCMVLHGTNGVELRNNICYDIKGHAIFLEDAVERRNIIEGNLVLKVRSPVPELALSEHEKRNMCGASAGYWLTNPDNTVRNNAVADAQGNGFWLSYPEHPVKQNVNVPIRPQNLKHAVFEYNSARSNGNVGLMLECVMTDDAGNLTLLAYSPTTDGTAYNGPNGVRFEIKGITTAKNHGGYVNRAVHPDYLQWAAADNLGRAFSGAVQMGSTLKQSLIIGKSLNNRETEPSDSEPQLGVASYHSAMDITQNTFVNLTNRGDVLKPNGWDRASGTFGTDDYYVRAVEKGFARNPGNRLINADAGYHAVPPHLQSNYTVATKNNWTLAGAIWDPQGYWGTAGRYLVQDSNFLRDDTCFTLTSVVPAGRANGLSCVGPYYGIGGFSLNRNLPGQTTDYLFMETIDVQRLDASDAEIGRWRVEQGYTSNFLGNMRHFAAVKGGSFRLTFPDFPNANGTKSPPRWVSLSVENMVSASDNMMLAIHFDGAITPSKVYVSSNPDYPNYGVDSKRLTAAASRAEVAAGTGTRFWQDKANNLVWVKLTQLGFNSLWRDATVNSDDDLYRTYTLRIEP